MSERPGGSGRPRVTLRRAKPGAASRPRAARAAVAGAAALALGLAAWSCGGDRADGSADAGSTEASPGAAAATPASPGERGLADSTLARLVAELLPEVERSSGLSFRRPPALARSGRERLERYLTEQLREQLPPERARAVTAAYARFGLVPDTLELGALLMSLYTEQVVGYYDPALDTLFVLETVPAEQLRAVLAHELAHALQDQHVDLDSLMKALADDNDAATAAQAAVEGHATLAMLEIELGRMTGGRADVTVMPDLAAQLRGVDLTSLAEVGQAEALGAAPRVIREALVFPYVGGLGFVQAVWRERSGRPAPFGEDLPASTEQILHPERFLQEPRDDPTSVRFDGHPPAGWREVWSDGLGELEIRLWLEEHLGDGERAARAAAGWDGDRYRLLRGPGGEALVWATVWDDAAEAEAFAVAAREAAERRYGGGPAAAGRRVEVRVLQVEGREGVLLLDLPAGLEAGPEWPAAAFRPEGGGGR